MGSPDPTTWLHFVRDFARTLGHEELSDSSPRPMRSQALGGWASVRWRGVFFRRIVKLGSAGNRARMILQEIFTLSFIARPAASV